ANGLCLGPGLDSVHYHPGHYRDPVTAFQALGLLRIKLMGDRMATATEAVTPQPIMLGQPGSARRWTPGKIVAWVILIAITVLFVTPLLWMISTSLKTPQDLMSTNW